MFFALIDAEKNSKKTGAHIEYSDIHFVRFITKNVFFFYQIWLKGAYGKIG